MLKIQTMHILLVGLLLIKRYDSERTYCNTNSSGEGNHSAMGSWDERNLWMSNLDLQTMADLFPSNGWGGEVITEEGESCLQHNVSRWMHQPSSLQRQLTVRRQPMCVGFFKKFADNVEIMELYESCERLARSSLVHFSPGEESFFSRRRVSTSLDSDFCGKLDTMVLSLLDRQRKCCFDEEDHPFWQQKDEYRNSSCVTAQNHTMCHSEHQKHASSPPQSSKRDAAFMYELRSGMTQIHEELHELRELVKSCIEKQVELHDYIKRDILEAIGQSSQ